MKRAIFAVVGTVCGLALLLSFKSHPSASTGTQTDPEPSATPSGTATTRSAAHPGSAVRTVTGDTIDTRWGPVQVQLTIKNGRITRARAVKFPDSHEQSREINDSAVPQLDQETVAAQSARIDAVSGASYTSEGYLRSLQSALDKAGR